MPLPIRDWHGPRWALTVPRWLWAHGCPARRCTSRWLCAGPATCSSRVAWSTLLPLA